MQADVRLLKLRNAGMFSNVNEVVEQLRRARRGNYRFVIDWTDSPYSEPGWPGDPWDYYFYPCFKEDGINTWGSGGYLSEFPILSGGVEVACACDNIITPRERDGVCAPLLLPLDRQAAYQLIKEYLVLKDDVLREINLFDAANFDGYVIGLHIRGPGRTDGGVPLMRRVFGATNEVPLTPFFEAVNQEINMHPNAMIFACSDSNAVMTSITARYGKRVICWPAIRSEFGEMHAHHPNNLGQTFSGYRLGLDVLVEAYLLARTSFFVHGNSNVANYVLCLNPEIRSTYIRA